MRSFIFIAVYLCRACSARSLRWAYASRSATRRLSPVANATIITRRHDITHRTNISLIIYFNNATSLWQPANNVHRHWQTDSPYFLVTLFILCNEGKTTKYHLKRKCFFYFRFDVNNYFGLFYLVPKLFDNFMKANLWICFWCYCRTLIYGSTSICICSKYTIFYNNKTWLYVWHFELPNTEKD